MLRLVDVTLSIGPRELLNGSTWHVRPADKVGLVGTNGSGKTTLLRLMRGEMTPEKGTLLRRGDLRIGYLPQEGVAGSNRTLWDEARTALTHLDALQERIHQAQADVEAERPGAIDRLSEATEVFRHAGGFSMDETIGEVLHGLGFHRDDWDRRCDTFSGGWQMRIALARLLLSDANLLLLDEPTNHLDLLARGWLTRHLSLNERAVVVVSHDRYLLDHVCKRIVEIQDRKLVHFTGNFSFWLEERERRIEAAQSAFEAQKREIDRIERFVDRFRAKATKAAQAKSREKMLDKVERLEAPTRVRPPRLTLPACPPCSQQALALRKGRLGWPDRPPVLQNVDIELGPGMRVAVLGANGTGKSTLLLALAGRLKLLEGQRIVGTGVRVGVFTQDSAQVLPMDEAALDHVLGVSPFAEPQAVRNALGSLGLGGDKALRPIGSLSGGERTRVALAAFIVQAHNVLLLDEPTNHLDAMTVDVLAGALQGFPGVLLFVTHDRFLVERVATHIVNVEGGRMILREGIRPEDFEPPSMQRSSTDPTGQGAEIYSERKKRARVRERREKRIQSMQTEIEGLEVRIGELDADMAAAGADYARAMELSHLRKGAEERIEVLFSEWQILEAEQEEDE